MAPAAVEIDRLTVVRGRTTVLPELSLAIEAGAITGLLGPSGCGKTTLIRAIAGLQIIRAGRVDVLGEPAGSSGNRRRVAYMTQASSTYPDLTVRQNLDYFARLAGVDPSAPDRVLEQVGLSGEGGALVGRLSGGQRARVSLAAALLVDARLLLLDEPTVGLDPVLRRELWGLFRQLADDGATLLVSSHVMDEAARCDQVILMRDGRLLAQESPAALLAEAGVDDLEDAFVVLAGRAAA